MKADKVNRKSFLADDEDEDKESISMKTRKTVVEYSLVFKMWVEAENSANE